VPVLTDIHEPSQAAPVAEVADVLQIPRSCPADRPARGRRAHRPGRQRQEGQFLAPRDMRHVVAKVDRRGQRAVLAHRARHSFGYNNLVVDMRAFPMLRELGYPVVFDVTHSLQLPGAATASRPAWPSTSSRWRRAGVAAGVDGVFLEVHEEPAAREERRAERAAARPPRAAAAPLVGHRRVARPRREPWLTSTRAPRPGAQGAADGGRRHLALVDADRRALRARGAMLRDCRGRVIVTGMGKSGIICRKIAATLSSTGTPAFFLHPAEAMHGDLGVHPEDDVVHRPVVQRRDRGAARLLETIRGSAPRSSR
jgi:hypothetical protein